MSIGKVSDWMTFLGWSNGGAPGGVKTIYGGSVVASHGDAIWIADVERAIRQIDKEREDRRAEEIRRNSR